jgi:hypothetical protein
MGVELRELRPHQQKRIPEIGTTAGIARFGRDDLWMGRRGAIATLQFAQPSLASPEAAHPWQQVVDRKSLISFHALISG